MLAYVHSFLYLCTIFVIMRKMRRILLILVVLITTMMMGVQAQVSMYVWQNGQKITYPIYLVDSITFGEEAPFAPLISVEDGSVNDWKKVPSTYLASASSAAGAQQTALKNVKVYADEMYINVLVEYDDAQITNKSLVPFHIYINTDNSAATGGYGEQWSDADIDVMLEGFVFENNQSVSYNPAIAQWQGTVGGDGWNWGVVTATNSPVVTSQMVGNKIEMQVVREYIPATWNDEGFTIGFDIQQDWNSVGMLPNAAIKGQAKKLAVTIDWEGASAEEETPSLVKTVNYVESYELFANPERGFLKQIYYTSQSLNTVQTANAVKKNRENENVTLYLDNYFMMDYMSSDISQAFLNRMENNFKALRAGGGKAVIRYSYKYNDGEGDKPWDATSEWILRHIEQLKPYWQEYADVILCLEAGFIGVWGEWYYTSNFPFNPTKDSDFAPRWTIVNALLEALPADRQVALRTPAFKMRYLDMHGENVAPLTAEEAYQNTAKARLCGHNDCFVASSTDYGTYANNEEREFWAEDTQYTLMGGETCGECELSTGKNAIKEMAKYHWTYINDGYHGDVLNSWEEDGSMTEIKRRLGYRFVLEQGEFALQDNHYSVELTLRNVGFAALANPRDVELVFVSKTDTAEKYVYKQAVDPRFWMAGETTVVTLQAELSSEMWGEYDVYLNLPDPYATLHDNPAYSIRLANENMWDETTGYNYLTDVKL